MIEHPYGWLSLLPPVVAIAMAIVTRRIVVSLFLGIFVGAATMAFSEPGSQSAPASAVVSTIAATFTEHLWPVFLDADKMHVFVFTMLMGAMIGIINRAAGMRGLVNLVAPLARNRRRGQLATWFLGLFIFFDDYANTMLLGNTLRPLTDKLRIAREKLAYLVDSTAAPVAGLVLVSTWVAGEIGYVEDGLSKLPDELEWKASSLFVASIPYRFYVIWALLFVPMVAIVARDFGPMWKAEQDAIKPKSVDHSSSAVGTHVEQRDETAPADDTKPRWLNAVVPVAVTVGATIAFLFKTGYDSVSAANEPVHTLQNYFGDADSYSALLWGALCGLISAVVWIAPQKLISFDDMKRAAGNGALKMLPALVILWLASVLSTMTGNGANASDAGAVSDAAVIAKAVADRVDGVGELAGVLAGQKVGLVPATITITDQLPDLAPELTAEQLQQVLIESGYDADEVEDMMATMLQVDVGHSEEVAIDADPESAIVSQQLTVPYPNQGYRLYTGIYLSNLLGSSIMPALFPTIVFILAGVIAFSTGTSWGTMGIVMPLVIPLVYNSLSSGGETVSSSDPILLGSIAGVLAGAIFGDHCSPISDTTVLSSQATSCNHIAHVRTQLPYALVVSAISIVSGTLPIGFGVPVWLCLPTGIGLMLVFLLAFGKRVEEHPLSPNVDS